MNKWKNNAPNYDIIEVGSGAKIATIETAWPVNEREAHIALIATAPDLYEALKAISTLDKQLINTGDFITSLIPLIQMADEALKKADGVK